MGKFRQDIDAMKMRLRQSEDALADLQQKHEACLADLKSITEEAEGLVKREKAGEEDRAHLKDSLDKLVEERNELIYRMNDLTEKYDQYVQAMTKERDDISKANKNHSKLLTASILFAHLSNRRIQRLGLGMEHIKKMAKYRKVVARRIGELARLQELFKQRLAARAFSKWHHGQLSWPAERHINEALIDKAWAKRQRAKFFLHWQTQFQQSADRKNAQIEAARRIVQLRARQEEKGVRRCFGQWVWASAAGARRDLCLRRILLRTLRRYEEDAFLLWLHMSKKRTEEAKMESLADAVADEKFKRQLFARMRHNVYLQEDEKVAESQVVLDTKNASKQRNRFLKAATIVFMNLNKKKENELRTEAFESVKFNVLAEKKDRTATQLGKELPECAALESTLKQEAEEQKANRKARILQSALLVFRRKLHYYFERWQNVGPIADKNTFKLKRIISRWYLNKVSAAFSVWYGKAHKQLLAAKTIEQHAAEENVGTIEEEIKELDAKLTQQKTHMQSFTLSKLQRVAHMISRRLLRSRVQRWRDSTTTLRRVELGGRTLSALWRKHSLDSALEKYRKQVGSVRKAMGDEYKEGAIRQMAQRHVMRQCLRGLRGEGRRMRTAKRAMAKMARGLDKDYARRLIARWRTNGHTAIKEQVRKQNEQLAKQNEDTQKNIEEIHEKSKRVIDHVDDMKLKERTQAMRAAIKNYTIWSNRRLADYTQKWRKIAGRRKRISEMMSRYVVKKEKNNLRAAMSSWLTSAFLTRVRGINEELKARVGKYDTFTRMSTIKMGETNEEITQLKEAYKQICAQNMLDERKMEMATGILDRLRQLCIPYPFHGNFFLGWVDMFRRERLLQGKAQSISKMYAGKYIYAKLKQVAEQNRVRVQLAKHWARALQNIQNQKERLAVEAWRGWTQGTRQQTKMAQVGQQDMLIENSKKDLEDLHDRADITYEREVMRRRGQKAIRMWHKQALTQRLLKRKAAQFGDTIRVMRLNNSFVQWRADVAQIVDSGEKAKKADSHSRHTLMKSTLVGWRTSHRGETTLPKVLHSLSRRQYLNRLSESFERIVGNAKRTSQRREERRMRAANDLSFALHKILSTRIAAVVARLSDNSQRRKQQRDVLQKMMLRRFRAKRSACFGRWRQKAEEYKLVDNVEAKGKSAEEVSTVLRRRESLKKIINQEGLAHRLSSTILLRPMQTDQSEIREITEMGRRPLERKPTGEESKGFAQSKSFEMKRPTEERKAGEMTSLSKREPSFSLYESKLLSRSGVERKLFLGEKKDLTGKYVTLWMRKVSGRDLLGKYVDMWRKWLRYRQTAERCAEFVMKRLRFGAKAWAFDKLRNLRRAGSRSFEEVPRPEIIKKYRLP